MLKLTLLTIISVFFTFSAHATTSNFRQPWSEFVKTESYSSFKIAIRKMKDNADENDPNSWGYWGNIHENHCPHGTPYFLAWHRGYISLFESKLRELSGDSKLMLPYWDYYTDPNIPKEFTDNTANNPLYAERVGSNVVSALSLRPFEDQFKNFQRGADNAFEPQIESRPHNPVHNLIGGFMPTMQSPRDPIFWLHHANVDRLWAAWVVAGSGRSNPDKNSSYWASTFVYSNSLSLPKIKTFDTETELGYTYDNLKMPINLPSGIAPTQPPLIKQLKPALDKSGIDVFSLNKGVPLTLGKSSFSVGLKLGPKSKRFLNNKLFTNTEAPSISNVKIKLRGVNLTELGRVGGYYYNVYLNLPKSDQLKSEEEKHILGTLGPFEINTALHHHQKHAHHGISEPLTIEYDATSLLKNFKNVSDINISFVRIDVTNSKEGDVISIGDFNIEVSENSTE